MTGCYTLMIDGVEKKSVELPEELYPDIVKWWYGCKTGAKLEILCELEV